MAAETVTIANGTNTITGARMSATAGIKCVRFFADGELQDLKTYHIKGVNGNYISRGGTTGSEISIVLRFIGPDDGGVNDPYLLYESANAVLSHSANIKATPWTITYRGTSYTRCEATSAKRISEVKPTGRNETPTPYVWFDVEYRFTTND